MKLEVDWQSMILMVAFWAFVLTAYFEIWKRRHDRTEKGGEACQPRQIEEIYHDDGMTFARKIDYDPALSERDKRGPPSSDG